MKRRSSPHCIVIVVMKTTHTRNGTRRHAAGITRALRRAARAARRIARARGTPIYVWRNGKVVACKPDAS